MTDAPKNIIDNYEQVLPGVFTGVPIMGYHSEAGISKSNICEIAKSPAHYKISLEAPQKETDSLLKGSGLHDSCLLPDFYRKHYKVAPTSDKRTKKYIEFAKKYPNHSILTPKIANDIREMKESIFNNPTMKDVLNSDTTLREVSIWAKDPITGMLLKVRPDMIYSGVIFDIKTTIAPHKEAFVYSCRDWHYHVQASYYMYVASLIGMKIDNFIFLVVGNHPPYLTAHYDLPSTKEEIKPGSPDISLEEGERFYRSALNKYKDYLESEDDWDGLEYGRELVTL